MDKFTKASQAMRFGATLTKQNHGSLARRSEAGILESTCALGAIAHATGSIMSDDAEPPTRLMRDVINHYGLDTQRVDCPACLHFRGSTIETTIVHLNDHHRWSRELIAGWLERKGL